MSGMASTLTSAALSLATISGGVFFGAKRPNHTSAVKPGTVSEICLTPGSSAAGLLEATPSRRSLPSFTAPMICGDGVVISVFTSPVRRAMLIGASPL
jgi:hypothetical protein